jgi:hypothetical protein
MPVDPKTEGLQHRYNVSRVDGKDKGPYFVLAYTTDPHARAALAEYADSCRDEYPSLAADLIAELSRTELDDG